jgi:hypothetical protein
MLRTNHPGSREVILKLYRRFQDLSFAEIGVVAVFRSGNDGFHWQLGEKTAAASDLRSAVWGLEAALCEAIIGSQQRLMAIHAATLYLRNSAVLLVGASGVGKSTLSVALSQRGFTLATDDVALIDPQTLHVHPIPRCVHLDQHSVLLLGAEGFHFPNGWRQFSFLTPVDLDTRPTPQCKAGLLIYIAAPRASRPHLRPVSQSEMAARLLSETGQGQLTDSENLAMLARVSISAGCFHLVPGSLSETVDVVSDLILGHQSTPIAIEHQDSGAAKFG